MTNANEETLATRVANQRAEVEKYRQIIKDYKGVRWENSYLNTLREMEAELADLEAQLASEQQD